MFVAQCRMLVRDYDVTALVHSADSTARHFDDNGIQVIQSPTYSHVKSQPISPGMIWPLIVRRFDLVHLHFPNVIGCLLLIFLQRRARLVIHHHAEIVGFGTLGSISTWFYRLLLRRTGAITILSRKILASAPSLRGFDGPITAIPACIDEDAFPDTDEVRQQAKALRDTHGGGRIIVTAVARLVPYKGIQVLLEAVAAVPEVTCFVAGEGPERERLERRAAELGLAGRCIFFGLVSHEQKHAILRASDIFVLASLTPAETFAVSQVEAQVCGLPVIASDIPTGVTEVTVAGKTGICFPPGDKDALIAAIRKLASDPELRHSYGKAGKQHAAENFSFRAVRDRLLAIYSAILSGKAGVAAHADTSRSQ